MDNTTGPTRQPPAGWSRWPDNDITERSDRETFPWWMHALAWLVFLSMGVV